MSVNLVNLIKDSISDDVINQISTAISAPKGQTKSATNSGIPGLLHHFAKISANKLGAEAMFQSASNQDDSILDHLGEQLSAENHKLLANSGTNILNTLLGGIAANKLVHDISGQSGLSSATSSTFLGLLTPIVVSVIKRTLLSRKELNSRNLANMLDAQKDNIAKAMPPGFMAPPIEHDLETTAPSPIIEEVTVKKAPKITAEEQEHPRTRIKTIALLLLPVILFLGYKLLVNKPTEMDTPPPPDVVTPKSIVKDTPATVAANDSILDELKLTLSSVANLLGDISDKETAKAIIPELDAEAVKIQALSEEMKKHPDDVKAEATSMIKSTIPHLQIILDRINEIPGVKPIIDPAIDNIIDKLALIH